MKREALVSILGTLPLLAALGSAPTGQLVARDGSPSIHTRQLYVPDDYPTIQAAIQAAMDADEILVRPGTYVENLDFLGKDITVRSTRGPEVTTIDGNQAGSVVTFANSETAASVLEGFTITNGLAAWGGGICVLSASPTIRNNVITGNRAQGPPWAAGGGIYAEHSRLRIEGNRISHNLSYPLERNAGAGGGILCELSEPVIHRNVIFSNTARGYSFGSGSGGGIYCGGPPPTGCRPSITQNVIRDNWASGCDGAGGGVAIFDAKSGTVADNVIVRNGHGGSFEGDGAGMYIGGGQALTLTGNTIAFNGYWGLVLGCAGLSIQWSSSIELTNSILWGNCSLNANPVWPNPQLWIRGSSVNVSDCDIGPEDTGGSGFINEDPLFVDPANGDFRLLPASPCIDSGDPASMPGGMDAWGNPRLLDGDFDGVMTVDMGAQEFDWVHLDVTGDATPGGRVTAVATWAKGFQPVTPYGVDPAAFLFVGTASSEVVLPPFGTLFVDPASPWMSFRLGDLAGSRSLDIPPDWPVGLEPVLQALTLVPPYGNFSNPVALSID